MDDIKDRLKFLHKLAVQADENGCNNTEALVGYAARLMDTRAPLPDDPVDRAIAEVLRKPMVTLKDE